MRSFTASHRARTALPVALAVGLAACSTGTPSSAPATEVASVPASAAAEGLTIAFVPENIQDPGFRAMQRAMIRAGEEFGDTIKPGDAENTIEKQVTVIENMVASGVDCLVIRARNKDTLAPATQAAHDAGIPVVGIFDTFPGADVVIAFDQTELGSGSGKLGGQYLNDNFGGEGKVIVLNADSLGGTTIDRAKGIVSGLAEVAPNAEVVANVEAYTVDDAETVVSSALQANPDARLVIGINDSAARGGLAALKNAGKSLPGDAAVAAIAGEGTLETLNLIKSGEIVGTTSAALLEIAAEAVPTCHKLVDGEAVDEKITYGPLKQITKENVDAQLEFIEELNKIPVE